MLNIAVRIQNHLSAISWSKCNLHQLECWVPQKLSGLFLFPARKVTNICASTLYSLYYLQVGFHPQYSDSFISSSNISWSRRHACLRREANRPVNEVKRRLDRYWNKIEIVLTCWIWLRVKMLMTFLETFSSSKFISKSQLQIVVTSVM